MGAEVLDFDPHGEGLNGGAGFSFAIPAEATVEVRSDFEIGNLVSDPSRDEGLVVLAEGFTIDRNNAASFEPQPGMSGIGLDQLRFQRPILGVGKSAILRMDRSDKSTKNENERKLYRIK